MAGEWFPLDADIGRKPETLELADRFDLEPATVVGRLAALWGWACCNCEAGTERMTARRMARLFGGDEEFWFAVEEVGWLSIDTEAGTITIPGWERRFSGAAKERLRHRQRAATAAAHGENGISAQKRRKSAGKAQQPPAHFLRPSAGKAQEKRSTVQDRTEQKPPPPPRESCAAEEPADGWTVEPPPADLAGAWETLRQAWNAQPACRPWRSPQAPQPAIERLQEPGWLEDALAAIAELPGCRYFTTPLDLWQLVKPGFAQRVLGGKYLDPKPPPGGPARERGHRPDDRPPPQAWTGTDAERFEATKRALAQRIRQEGAA